MYEEGESKIKKNSNGINTKSETNNDKMFELCWSGATDVWNGTCEVTQHPAAMTQCSVADEYHRIGSAQLRHLLLEWIV